MKKLASALMLLAAAYSGVAGGAITDTNQSPATNSPPSVEELRAKAEKGDPEAQTRLAMHYQDGVGIARDRAAALALLHKAADQNYPEAQVQLASQDCESSDPARRRAGLQKLRELAETGAARPQWMLGTVYLYFAEKGSETNIAEAMKWLHKAAEQNDAMSAYMIGAIYSTGTNGVPKDESEALKWLRVASEQDVSPAEAMLGMLLIPKHTKDEQAEGVKWLKEAAEQGFATAQMWLASCYFTGVGTDKDPVESFKWYKILDEHGFQNSTVPADLLAQLTPAELAEGAKRAAAFKPRKTRLVSSFPMDSSAPVLKPR